MKIVKMKIKIFDKLKRFIPKSKRKKHEEKLLKDYEMGKILQVDKEIDNKKYIMEIENGKHLG